MWAPLQHPGLVEFYEEFHRGRYERDEDWQPMIRAVQYLQSQPYAPRLFAFTSHANFHVTTAPSYQEFPGHRTVGITWRFRDRSFHLSFQSGTGARFHKHTCEEQHFPFKVDSLINGLLLYDDYHDG